MSKDNRKTLIAKIHIGKKQLRLDEATYRDVLVRVTGKDSLRAMDLGELKKVIADMKKHGFVPSLATVKKTGQANKSTQSEPQSVPPQSAPKWGKKPEGADEKMALIGKIEAMLADMDLHWNYAHGMAQRMFGILRVQWLNQQQLYKLTQALAVHQAKQRAKEQAQQADQVAQELPASAGDGNLPNT